MTEITIADTIQKFLENISLTRSGNTEKTYQHAMKAFLDYLSEEENIKPEDSIQRIQESLFSGFAKYLKLYSVTTETLYINVIKNYYGFLEAENFGHYNLEQIKLLIRQRTRKPGIRLPQFPKDSIEKVLIYAYELPSQSTEKIEDHLINLRDSAFLITLADTGLRIHEACGLRRGDIDWFSEKAIIIGKGNKQAVVRFSNRSIMAMRNYLNERALYLDSLSGRQLSAIPVFARHDKGAGKNILPITTKTGRLIVSERVKECLGEEAVGTITPHSFRHYFVTCVLHETGNLKIAQEFARHANITTTQRYSHLVDTELDETYRKIFDKPDDDIHKI